MKKRVYELDKCLKSNLDAIKDRINQKKASLIIIDGGLGEGKTTLAVECGDYLQGHDINLHEQYGMGGSDFIQKVQISTDKKHCVTIYDEAGDFSKRGSLTVFNRLLNRVFETYRAYGIVVIIAVPNFNVLDNHLFDLKIPRLLLNVYNRRKIYGTYRAYSLYRMHYLKYKMKNPKLVVKNMAYGQVYPNFYGRFHDLPPSRSKQLERISLKGKKEIVSEGVLKSQGLLSYSEIADKLSRSVMWVRKRIWDRRLKHKKVYKRKKYFDKNIIDILIDDVK